MKLFKVFFYCLQIRLYMSCFIDKEQCICNIISSILEMNCNQYTEGFKILNLTQVQHNYSNKFIIKLIIRNKKNFEIRSTKSQMTLQILMLEMSQNEIKEIDKNSFDGLDNLKYLIFAFK
jgi:hypothetical protein